MARCLLIESGLEKCYWGEAVNTANYLLNRLPASATGRTPFELWFGKKPCYGHLKVFGSPAYVHVPKERRRKLDEKGVRLIFVGYAEGRKAYRFLNTESKTVTISRDAKFLEAVGGAEMIRKVLPEEKKSDNSVSVDRSPVEEIEEIPLVEDPNIPEECEAEVSMDYGTAESDFEGFPNDEIYRRSKRVNKGRPPARLIEEANAVQVQEEIEPDTFKEAVSSENSVFWLNAMKEELKSHEQLKTWSLVPLPAERRSIGSRWIFKVKKNANGETVKYKARLVAQGYAQKQGVDFEDVYAPVAKQATLRVLLAVASSRGIVLKHMDVKTAYLNGKLSEEVYMRQPPGFSEPGKENLVCRLHKSIYGLKQSARCWNQQFDVVLKEIGFKPSSADPCMYTMVRNGKTVYVVLYVDDIVVGCEDELEIDTVHSELNKHFEITALGVLKYFLGLEVERVNGAYSLSLSSYIRQTAKRFGLGEAKSSKTPMDEEYARGDVVGESLEEDGTYRSLVGALLYIAVNARPDIAAAVAILGRKVSKPTTADYQAAKRVVRYLLGTVDWKLQYHGGSLELAGYVDADWAGDHATRKSTSGFVFMLNGAAISWMSRQQNVVSLSSMESEYIALCEAAQETLWLRRLLVDFGIAQTGSTIIHEDNQSCIAFARSERISKRSKHIETKEMFVRDLCDRNIIQLRYLCSEKMLADALTKALGPTKITMFSTMMGLKQLSTSGT